MVAHICRGQRNYCLLCRIHNTTNKFNKINTINISPSTNYKYSAVVEHAKTQGHIEAFKSEILRRDSALAKQHEQARETKDVVTANVFLSCYWLGKEEVANRKLKSLINLEKDIGVKEMGNFKKVQVGKGQEKAQPEKDSHSKNRGGKKPNQQSGTYTTKQS